MNWKVFARKLLFPPLWLLLLLVPLSAVLLALVFLKDLTESPVVYAVYVLAFYTLCTVCAFCALILPVQYREIQRKVHENPIGHRYLTDAAFKTHVSLYASLMMNLLYVGVNVLSWFLYRSMWFVVLACYYTILAVMRFLLVRYVRCHELGKSRLGELQRARLCSCILLLLNFALTGAVMMILYQNKGFEYQGVLIYVMAAYTFYMTTHAIVDLIKYRKYQSPVMTTGKIVALSAALVSMLSLETAMFSQFGADMAPEHQWLMIALTGAGVSVVVISMAVYMIIQTAKEIKATKRNGRQDGEDPPCGPQHHP